MTAAKTGWGGTFSFDDNSGTPFEWVEVKSFTLPNGSVEQLDATHLQSPNRRREKIAGMIDDGDLTVVLNYVPGSTTDVNIMQAFTEGDIRTYTAVVPRVATDWEITGDAFIAGVDRGEITPDGIMEVTVTLTLSGASTEGS
jgi:predicted secreted protein